MSRSRKLALFTLTSLPVIVLIVASMVYLKHQTDWLARHANVIIAGELERRFGKQVRVGDVQAGTLGIAVFKDVRVAKGKTLREGTLASAATVTIRYDWRALILGGKGAGSVSEVDVADPRVLLIRRQDGTFNITELLKPPPGPRKPPFSGVVKVTGGEATFIDFAVRPGEQPTTIQLHDLVGSIRAAAQPVYTFGGTASGKRGQFDRGVFSGSYHALTKRTVIRARAGGVSAPTLAPYVWKSKAIQVLAGNLNTDATLDVRHVNGRYTVSVEGNARVNNAAIRLSLLKAPATNVNGTVTVSGGRATAKLSGIFAGAPVRSAGSLIFRNQIPTLDLVIDSSSIEMSRLLASTTFLGALSQFSPAGRGPVHAKFTGSMSDLSVEATAHVPRASIRGVPVQEVSVSATYQSGRVDLRSVELSAKGATIQASGSVLTGPVTTLDLHGRFANLDLGLIPARKDLAVAGKASGTFIVSGSSAAPSVSVKARAANGTVAGVPFSSVEGDIRIAGSRAKVNDLLLRGVFNGQIRASGVASASSIDLSVSAESIDISKLAGRLGEPGYAGTAFLNGHITGTPKSPRFEGSVEVFGGRTKEYSIDHALIAFTADQNKITVSEGVVQMFPAELRFSGEALGLETNRVSVAGKASVRRLEVTKLLELSKRDVDVTGTILGDFTFSGAYLPKARPGTPRFVDAVASGSLSLEDGTAFGYPVTSASARLDYSGNILKLADASIVSDKARLTLNGTANTDTHAVDGNFSLAGFDLMRLQEITGDYVALAGAASASGAISGLWDNVKLSADAKVDGLAINYEKFDRAELKFAYNDGKVASYSATLARAGQSLEITGTDFDSDTSCLASAKGVLTDISVPDIMDIVRASPYFSSKDGASIAQTIDKLPKITTGRLSGSFELAGCLQSSEGEPVLPDGKIDLTATNVGIDVQQIQSIELHASAKSGVVTLGKFLAVSDDSSLEASGDRAYENGNLRMEVKAENIKLSRLSPWLGTKTPDGTLSATFNIDGPLESPDIIGSVEVIKPGYAGFSFDSVRASQVQITANRIEIPNILISAQGHQATAKASVPWDWMSLSIPNDEPISVSAELSRQPLNIVSVLLPLVDAAKTTGAVDAGWFQLNGTMLDPQLAGSLKVTGGTIALTGFTNTFTDVKIDLGFVGDRIVVNAASASSSQGGNVHVVPGGYVAVGILGTSDTGLRIVADRLAVGEKNLLGLKEDVVTQIDAGLSVTGPPNSPTVADAAVEGKQGGITLSHAKLSFQMMTTRGELPAIASVNPKLNVSLRLGQDVVISPPSMQLTVAGGGVMAGTLLQPSIAALNMTVVSGEINLATARLRIMQGGTINVAYIPPATPDVRVDLQATASVFAVNSIRQRDRYQITMRITGQAAKPQITLTSSPPGLTREQMLAAMGHVPALFSSAETGLQNELANVLTAAAASTLFAPIENIFVQKLGFEQFSLEYSAFAPLSLYISHQLVGRLYLAFYRRLSAALTSVQDVEYQVMLNYRLNPTYQFSFGVDDQQTTTFQFGYAKAFR
jgi:autotransporter translocation and assembly factor TamB